MLIDKLSANNKIPMHMPGHKRNTALAPYLKSLCAELDITEIEGFDNLHAPGGIILESMKKAAALRNTKSAFYLVNGSTAGILAGISAVVEREDTVICARNCHKSVYNALELVGASPVFVMPKIHEETGISGSISPNDIAKKIKENPNTKLIIITSPTYEGVVSDVEKICAIAHSHKIPVFVDAAHGAHLGFSKGFLKDAVSCGADISVESLHKTLPSLTQTAVLYVNSKFVDVEMVAERLTVFQTTSPSYLLMASIDGCVNLLAEKKEELFSTWEERLLAFYKKCDSLENLRILKNNGEFFGLDISKIVILTKDGNWLADALRKMGIECEMIAPGYVVAMTGMGDTKEMLSYFAACLLKLDEVAEKPENAGKTGLVLPKRVLEIKPAKKKETEEVAVSDIVGRISAEYVWAYPPGIPIITPGEECSAEIRDILVSYLNCCSDVLKNVGENKVRVVK